MKPRTGTSKVVASPLRVLEANADAAILAMAVNLLQLEAMKEGKSFTDVNDVRAWLQSRAHKAAEAA